MCCFWWNHVTQEVRLVTEIVIILNTNTERDFRWNPRRDWRTGVPGCSAIEITQVWMTPAFIWSIKIIISSINGAGQTYEHPLCLQKRFAVGLPQMRRELWFLQASGTRFSHTICCFFKREALRGSRQRGRGLRHWTTHKNRQKEIRECFFTALPTLGFGEFRIWQVVLLVHPYNQRY